MSDCLLCVSRKIGILTPVRHVSSVLIPGGMAIGHRRGTLKIPRGTPRIDTAAAAPLQCDDDTAHEQTVASIQHGIHPGESMRSRRSLRITFHFGTLSR